jgi:hypothetical protein
MATPAPAPAPPQPTDKKKSLDASHYSYGTHRDPGSGVCAAERKQRERSLQHVFSILAILLEAGIFSVPHAFYRSGVIGGTVIIIFASVLSYFTISILLTAQHDLYLQTGMVYDYPQITSKYLQNIYWVNSVKIATTISCLGGCASFVIFIGQISSQELGISFESTVLFLTLPMIFLSWIRSFKDLAIFTIFGVLAMVSSIGLIIYEGLETINPDRLDIKIFVPSASLGFLGNATFLFTIHYCALSMGAEDLLRKHPLPHRHAHDVATDSTTTANESQALLPRHRDQQRSKLSRSNDSNLSYPMAIAFLIGTLVIICLGLIGPFIYSAAHHVR